MNGAREFEVIVYGASGFTGRLVAEYLAKLGGVAWAMAGRDEAKLRGVRDGIAGAGEVPIIRADASDPESLIAMARRAKVVLTTVGPYQLYGEPLITACIAAGADYVDLCGEPAWMAQMIERHQAAAAQAGSRIVFSCGFDSIPFDLGVWFLQNHAIKTNGAPLRHVSGRVRRMKGGFSGGTVASLLATLEAAQKDKSLISRLADPFALTAGFRGPRQPRGDKAMLDADFRSWATPFIMAAINTKNVHRTNFLLRWPYGQDFTYDEMLLTGDGPKGEGAAKAAATQANIQNVLLAFPPTRALLKRFALPKPGQGPSLEERETGMFDVAFAGRGADGELMRAIVTGDRDPGYGSTSKMIAQSALCLARDVTSDETPGGVWTPGGAMAAPLVKRLKAHAGLTFRMDT